MMITLRQSALVLSIAAVVPAGVSCQAGNEPAACDGAPSEAELAAAIEETGSDWRDRVMELAETAPGDSVMEVDVLYGQAPTEEVRQLLKDAGAVITYEYRLIPAFTVDITVDGLVMLAESPIISAVAIPRPGFTDIVPLGCS